MSDEHPLREFFSLLFMLVLIVVVAVVVLNLAAQSLAGYVPFSAEQRLVAVLGGPEKLLGISRTELEETAAAQIARREAYPAGSGRAAGGAHRTA